MGTQYDGIPSNIVPPGALTISSMSGSGVTPITITFSTPHNMLTGDQGRFYNIDGNTAANGTFAVTVTGSAQVTIPATGNGTYTGALPGQCQPLTFGASFQIPSDGDLVSGANANVAPETLGDRSAFVLAGTGQYKLANLFRTGNTSYNTAVGGWTITMVGAGSFVQATKILATVSGLQANDVIEYHWTGSFNVASLGVGSTMYLGLGSAQYSPNAAPPTASLVPTTPISYNQAQVSAYTTIVSVSGAFINNTTNGFADLYPMALGTNTAVLTFTDGYQFIYKLWRPTNAPQ